MGLEPAGLVEGEAAVEIKGEVTEEANGAEKALCGKRQTPILPLCAIDCQKP